MFQEKGSSFAGDKIGRRFECQFSFLVLKWQEFSFENVARRIMTIIQPPWLK